MSDHSLLHAAGNIAKDAPPVAVSGMIIFGVPVSDIVVILTGVYTVVRLMRELSDWWGNRKRKHDSGSAVHSSRK